MGYLIFFVSLFLRVITDPLEGYPDFTPDISLLDASLKEEILLVEIHGIHYQAENSAYILIYIDSDNNPLSGTGLSKGENPRPLEMGADYMLINLPDTFTLAYRTPSWDTYEFLGTLPSSYDTFPGGRFKVAVSFPLSRPSRRLNLVLFGGSEEFTDDRVPDSGYLVLGDLAPLMWITQIRESVRW